MVINRNKGLFMSEKSGDAKKKFETAQANGYSGSMEEKNAHAAIRRKAKEAIVYRSAYKEFLEQPEHAQLKDDIETGVFVGFSKTTKETRQNDTIGRVFKIS